MKAPPVLLFLAVLHTLAFFYIIRYQLPQIFRTSFWKKNFVTNFHFVTNRFSQTPPNPLTIFQEKKQTVGVEDMEFPGVYKKK